MADFGGDAPSIPRTILEAHQISPISLPTRASFPIVASGNMLVTGTLIETIIASFKIPANMMKANSVLVVYLNFLSQGSGTKTYNTYFGDLTTNLFTPFQDTGSRAHFVWLFIINQNALNAQYLNLHDFPALNETGSGTQGAITSAANIVAIDTTKDQTVQFTVLLGLITDSVTFRGLQVDLWQP